MITPTLPRVGACVLAAVLCGCDPPREPERETPPAAVDARKRNVSKVTYEFAAPGLARGGGAGIRAGETVRGVLEPGDRMLDDGTYYDVWTYAGRAGERLEATLSSPAFDAFLILARGAAPLQILAEDDDGAGSSDARASVVLPEDGRYYIIVNSVFPDETGEYTLRVDDDAG